MELLKKFKEWCFPNKNDIIQYDSVEKTVEEIIAEHEADKGKQSLEEYKARFS